MCLKKVISTSDPLKENYKKFLFCVQYSKSIRCLNFKIFVYEVSSPFPFQKIIFFYWIKRSVRVLTILISRDHCMEQA